MSKVDIEEFKLDEIIWDFIPADEEPDAAGDHSEGDHDSKQGDSGNVAPEEGGVGGSIQGRGIRTQAGSRPS